jgi:hypothetical protein
MKSFLPSLTHPLVWHTCHALALLLLGLVLGERLVPGFVLGHAPLFVAVPLLILCMTFHPIAEKPARWWMLVDVWAIAALCIGRIFMQLVPTIPLAWLLASFASMLTVAFLWIFSRDSSTL